MSGLSSHRWKTSKQPNPTFPEVANFKLTCSDYTIDVTKTKYEAPLYCPSQERRIPGDLTVILSLGWKFQKHEAVVGMDLKEKVSWILDREDLARVMYNCEDVDGELLLSIRADDFVDVVECRVFVRWPPEDGPQ